MHTLFWIVLYWLPAIYVSSRGFQLGCGWGIINSIIGLIPGINLLAAWLIWYSRVVAKTK